MKTSLVDLLIETQKRKEKYFKNWKTYGKRVKKIAKEILNEAEVLVFGSVVKDRWTPASDIDILIISKNLPSDFEKRTEIRTKIKSQIDPFSPLQLHLVKPEEFKNWYKKFIKKNFYKI